MIHARKYKKFAKKCFKEEVNKKAGKILKDLEIILPEVSKKPKEYCWYKVDGFATETTDLDVEKAVEKIVRKKLRKYGYGLDAQCNAASEVVPMLEYRYRIYWGKEYNNEILLFVTIFIMIMILVTFYVLFLFFPDKLEFIFKEIFKNEVVARKTNPIFR